MQYAERRSRLFTAIDESNHGRDEEVFVASFSYAPESAKYERVSSDLEKRRAIASQVHIPQLDYRFCVVDLKDYRDFGSHNIPREVARVFYHEFVNMGLEIDSTDVFFSTQLMMAQREEIKIMLRDLLNVRRAVRDKIPYPAVSVRAVPKEEGGGLIRSNNLLLFADYQANKLFRASRYSTTDKQGRYAHKRVAFPLHK